MSRRRAALTKEKALPLVAERAGVQLTDLPAQPSIPPGTQLPAYDDDGLDPRAVYTAGVSTAYTAMDDRNGPMLAVNAWLGYRRVATEVGLSRTLG